MVAYSYYVKCAYKPLITHSQLLRVQLLWARQLQRRSYAQAYAQDSSASLPGKANYRTAACALDGWAASARG
jgi:hypothetical protein